LRGKHTPKLSFLHTPNGHKTIITETFDAESKTPIDLQKDFCQSVLNSFKKYAESKME
jgi:hypothetical protein